MKSNKRMAMGKSTRLTLLIAFSILLAVAGYGTLRALTPDVTSEKNILYSYTISAGGQYEVRLFENELYPEGVLGEDHIYAKNLIDRLNITFTANYSGNQAASVSGNYSISVIVQGYQGNGDTRNTIYERIYPLVEDKPIKGETNAKISDAVSLDLNIYKDFADKAEQILNARPGREAKVVFSGTFLANTESDEINEPFSYYINFPLTNELFTITKESPVSITGTIDETKDVTLGPATVSVILPALGVLIALVAIFVLIFLVRRPTAEEQYILNFKAIQRKYGSRMSKLSALPSIPTNLQVEIADLDSLIKISDERQQSIRYSLNEESLPADGLLYVPDGERYYMLYLKK